MIIAVPFAWKWNNILTYAAERPQKKDVMAEQFTGMAATAKHPLCVVGTAADGRDRGG